MNIYRDGKSENLRMLLFLIDIDRYLKIFKDTLLFRKRSITPRLKSALKSAIIISLKVSFANRT